MTQWQADISIYSFGFAEVFAYFLLNQFIAYLMLQSSSPKDKS